MNRFNFEPDFENLKNVLMGKKGYRIPNAELVIDQEIKEQFLEKPVISIADEIEFRYQAGYDYAWFSIGMIDPAGTINKERVSKSSDRHFQGKDERVWADEQGGTFSNKYDIDAYPWPDPQLIDYTSLDTAATVLKPGMKVIAVLGKIFTAAWQLMGFTRFCEQLYTNPSFVVALIERIAYIQLEVLKTIITMDAVGAVWIPDDIAYKTGLMIHPQWFKDHLFPHYARMTEVCHANDKPVIYHSDGNLSEIIDTIIDTGFTALHPIEPEAMDIYALRKQIGTNLCLLGNISVNTLSIGSRKEIADLSKERLLTLGEQGAFCLGSGNSIPHYVCFDNYITMLQTNAQFHSPT